MSNFKDRLQLALQIRNMSPAELARKSKINESSISQYRNGAFKASQQNLEKIAKALNVTTSWLMGADVPMSARKVKIPVLGIIRAGEPIEAVQEIIDYVEITEEMSATGRFYALRVSGNSMAPRILDGDVVIVKKQDIVENNEVAIVLVNGNEATVKEVLIDDAGMTLVGWNVAEYPPHFYTKAQVAALPVRIIGLVVELRAKL